LAGPDKSEGVTSTFAELKIVADDDEINPAIDNLSIGRERDNAFGALSGGSRCSATG